MSENKIKQAIILLQEALGGGSGGHESGGSQSLPQLDGQIAKFTELSRKLDPEIQQLNNIFVESIQLMKQIMGQSLSSPKFSTQIQQSLKDKFYGYSKQTEAVEKNQNFIPHAKAIRQLISGTFWVFTNSPQIIFKGAIEAADFNALKFKTKKVMPHNEWYNELSESIKIIDKYVKSNYPMGLSFNSHGTGRWEDVISGTKSPSTQQKAPQQQKTVNKPSQQQQGKKNPKRQLAGINWNIANYQGQQITLAENQVKMQHGIFIQNCKQCLVKVLGRFKSIMLNKCQNVVVVVISCVSGVEVMNSESMTVQIKQSCPSVAIDHCSKVRLLLNGNNMNCDIVSAKVTQLNISYIKSDGNQAKDYHISQQLITRWNPNLSKFQTKVYDIFL